MANGLVMRHLDALASEGEKALLDRVIDVMAELLRGDRNRTLRVLAALAKAKDQSFDGGALHIWLDTVRAVDPDLAAQVKERVPHLCGA